MSYEKFFWAKTSVALFLSLKTDLNIAKEAINSRVIDERITWVSNTKTSNTNRRPVTKHTGE